MRPRASGGCGLGAWREDMPAGMRGPRGGFARLQHLLTQPRSRPMEIMESRQRRAAVLIVILGAALIIALTPFATGLLSAPVLFVIFAPVYRRLRRRLGPGTSAGLTVFLALLLILVPGLWLLTLIVGQAQDVLASLLSSEVLARLDTLKIGRFAIGPELVKMGQGVIGALGRGAFRAVGSVTLGMLN